MISADQNSRTEGLATLDAVDSPASPDSCRGCYYIGACPPYGGTICIPGNRADDRSIIWVARKPAENPATVAADILRAEGEDVDEASVARADAFCNEQVDPPEPAASASEQAPTPAAEAIIADTKARYLMTVPGYEELAAVLRRAYAQAATGKGAERHAQGQRFERQPMQDLIRLYGVGFALGQAAKKSQESMRLPTKERKVAELLGAIVYISGAIISIEQDE